MKYKATLIDIGQTNAHSTVFLTTSQALAPSTYVYTNPDLTQYVLPWDLKTDLELDKTL